ncbi:unnamed protein product [Rhodiola kirilowii]
MDKTWMNMSDKCDPRLRGLRLHKLCQTTQTPENYAQMSM